MIPILMQDEKTVGFLKESLSCVVTEERNGVFELSLTYPVTGALFDKLQIDRFVKAKPNDTADLQLFRIYEVTKPMNGIVTVNAEHVSYALSNFPVEEINITGTATQAINEVLSDVTSLLFAMAFANGVAVEGDRAEFCDLDGDRQRALTGTIEAGTDGCAEIAADSFGIGYDSAAALSYAQNGGTFAMTF